MKTEIKLIIAGIVIEIKSKYQLRELSNKEKTARGYFRFDNFFYYGHEKADIIIEVAVDEGLPKINPGQNKFVTYHYEDGKENWRIEEKKTRYIFKSPVQDKESLAWLDKNFQRARLHLLSGKAKLRVWDLTDVTDDFLHILLINYLAMHNLGVFAHGVGIRDSNGRGRLFCGKSGAGKSTSAKIWHKHSRAMVLNDDRIIVRKKGSKFYIYSVPWHGAFNLNFKKRIKSAVLKEIFFLYHAPKNSAVQLGPIQAFSWFYSTIFPVFWDKQGLENTANFCGELVQKIPGYSLGFKNDRKIINFIRKKKNYAGI